MGKRRINKQEISSDDEVNENVSVSGSESSAQDTETPAQKRLRLTKQYLAGIKGEEELQRDLLKSQGKWFAKMADNFQDFEFQVLRKIKTRSPCVAFVMFNDTCYYADQHGVYSFVDGEKQVLLAQNHTYAMDISFDGKYLVFGGKSKIIYVYNTELGEIVHKFTQHRDAISSLKFRKKSFDLYTASFDRCIKCFNVEELGYRETLFGHQDRVATIDTLDTERALSCGMRDKTVRIFKIVEESQLVFMSGGGHKYDSDAVVMEEMGQTEKKKVKDQGKSGGSIDSCCYIDQEYFLSGSDSGAISLWSAKKKKPLFTKLNCHGLHSKYLQQGQEFKIEDIHSDDHNHDTIPNWVVSLALLPQSDLFVSGSGDGHLRVWKINESKQSFSLVNTIPMNGFINQLIFTQKFEQGQLRWVLAVAVGQEYRFGRWWRIKEARNSAVIIDFGPVSE